MLEVVKKVLLLRKLTKPLDSVKGYIKGIAVKTIVFAVKQGILLATKETDESSKTIRQLRAIGDKNTSMEGLEKIWITKLTVDSLKNQAYIIIHL